MIDKYQCLQYVIRCNWVLLPMSRKRNEGIQKDGKKLSNTSTKWLVMALAVVLLSGGIYYAGTQIGTAKAFNCLQCPGESPNDGTGGGSPDGGTPDGGQPAPAPGPLTPHLPPPILSPSPYPRPHH